VLLSSLLLSTLIVRLKPFKMPGQRDSVKNHPTTSYTVAALASLVFIITVFRGLVTSPHNQLQQKAHLKTYIDRQMSANNSSSIASLSTSASLPCDEECLRFGRLLDVWPTDKPRAAVVLLLEKSPGSRIARSLHLLGANFNDVYNYPVIVFHEENMNNEVERRRLRSFSNSSLYFQVHHEMSY